MGNLPVATAMKQTGFPTLAMLICQSFIYSEEGYFILFYSGPRPTQELHNMLTCIHLPQYLWFGRISTCFTSYKIFRVKRKSKEESKMTHWSICCQFRKKNKQISFLCNWCYWNIAFSCVKENKYHLVSLKIFNHCQKYLVSGNT